MKTTQLLAAAGFFLAALVCRPAFGQSQQLTIPLSNSGTVGKDVEPGGTTYQYFDSLAYIGSHGTGYGTVYYHNYFVLDLSQFPVGDIITSATFTITQLTPPGGPGGGNTGDLQSSNLDPSFVLSATSQADLATVWTGVTSGTDLQESFTVVTNPANPFTYNETIVGDSTFLGLLNANIGGTLLIGNGSAPGSQTYDGGDPALMVTASPVPEPSTVGLIAAAAGFAIPALYRSRRRQT